MSRTLIILLQCGIIAASFSQRLSAADQGSAAEAKLRESLRGTMLQLRNAEAERATLQAAQAELEAKTKSLTEQMEALRKQAALNQADADKALAELKAKVDERDREIGSLRVTLDKWKADHQKVTEYAKTKEAQAAKLGERVIVLDRQVADQQRRNFAMYKLGTEILARYESFGLGTALTSREPFVGLTRVKFENLIQDYGDKLSDERTKPQPSETPQSKEPSHAPSTQTPPMPKTQAPKPAARGAKPSPSTESSAAKPKAAR
jgi:DNA repair exonuclease SbcCD ATPase subunit